MHLAVLGIQCQLRLAPLVEFRVVAGVDLQFFLRFQLFLRFFVQIVLLSQNLIDIDSDIGVVLVEIGEFGGFLQTFFVQFGFLLLQFLEILGVGASSFLGLELKLGFVFILIFGLL